MKALFMVIPALLLSTTAQYRDKTRRPPSAPAPPPLASKRRWFNWKPKLRSKDAG
jgi:hypothetical protein